MKTYLALLWHQHQPYYYDASTRELAMPWVRLHGIKDYYGMAALAEEFPRIRVNINLVPSLVRQLEMYVKGEAEDKALRISRKPAESLEAGERAYMLENFFRAQPNTMIAPHTRYSELWDKAKSIGKRGMTAVVRKVSRQDFLDLQVWATLAWFHPLKLERDAELAALHRKSRGYSEEDKTLMFAKQAETLASVVPLHRRLQEEGRIEILTTPYYHPILPLLLNMESAREAMPDVKLPPERSDLAVDADEQVRRAVEAYKGWFGVAPRGVWPAEGSVSPDTLRCFERYGFEWFATDEEILAATIERQGISPDKTRRLVGSGFLYRPYAVQVGSRPLGCIFRDKRLSDLIGFHYKNSDQVRAAEDLVAQVREIGRRSSNKPTLVSIILDGENAWEHYPDNGIRFLKHLYKLLSESEDIETVRVADFLREHPPKETLQSIFSGSWINRNFAIWVGHEEDNRAWSLLARAREALTNAGEEAKKRAGEANLALAWEELYIAEGSDWFWWFGDDHSSPLDDQFDALFRRHLANAYRFAGLEVPVHMSEPIKRVRSVEDGNPPWEWLNVTVDGRKTHYFEWVGAGHFRVVRQRGAMDRSARCFMTDVFYGFGQGRLYFRIDASGPIRAKISEGT
ncbi:MAG: glycoside hydrolase family 57 protein, partial [Planctomycetota bacterium]|nr:glycoside hydrolase family 57 protein [Planctomycetota bacterium]